MSFSLTRVAALANGQAYVTAIEDDPEDWASYSRVFHFDGANWSHVDLDFEVFSLAQTRKNDTIVSAVALGTDGEVEFLGGDSPRETVISPDDADRSRLRPGRFTQISEIAGTLYAVGEGGRNFRRRGQGVWEIMDATLLQAPMAEDWDREFFPPGVYETPDDPKNYGRFSRKSAYLLAHPEVGQRHTDRLVEVYHDETLWTIDGVSANDIFVGGRGNSIRAWQADKGRFSEPLLAPAASRDNENSVLDIGIGPDGTVYGSGGDDLLITGGRDGFRNALGMRGRGHLAAMAFFRGGHYLIDQMSRRGLWQFDGSRLMAVATGLDPEPGPLLSISASPDFLWAVGSKDIIRFDGRVWEHMTLPA